MSWNRSSGRVDRWERALTCALALSLCSAQAFASAAPLAGVDVAALLARSSAVTAASYDDIFESGFEDPCAQDADGDGLPDCVETNTGVYTGPSDTGTDPRNPDSDGDGLLDGDEVHGTADGLDLPAMGVSPVHRDLLIEYDWFDDADGCAQHSHRPTPDVVQAVHDFYAAAPVVNPDGTTGINVIQDYGQGGPFTGGNLVPGDGQLYGTVFGSDYQNYEAANFAPNRHGYFHYVLMAHTYDDTTGNTSSSGYAALPGYEAMVTLACVVTASNGPLFIRNSIIHELGHNLGLHHGGDEECNNKPNYSSVMNYRYEFAGVDTGCTGGGDMSGNLTPDYSHGDRLTLDENDLDENAGMCTSATVPVDWNADGQYESVVAVDINLYGSETSQCGSSTQSVLHDFDDWAHLDLASVSPLFFGQGAGPVAQTESLATSPTHKPGVGCAPIPKLHR
jgi:hypothetical protein